MVPKMLRLGRTRLLELVETLKIGQCTYVCMYVSIHVCMYVLENLPGS
jgi:hypothetical protein